LVGITCFINRQLIYNFPEQIFTEAGVISIEHADFDGIERLAAVTGGEIASTFDRPDLVNLGECALIDEIMVGEDKLIRFSGCKSGTACTVILRGASSHLLGTYYVPALSVADYPFADSHLANSTLSRAQTLFLSC
jgi:T-complex protein 1 subunit beta